MLAEPIMTGAILAQAMLAEPVLGLGPAGGSQRSSTPATAALAATDVVVSTEPQHAPTTAQQCGTSTTVSRSGAAPDSNRHNVVDPVATNTLTPAPAYPAAAAASVGWPGATAGQEPIAWGVVPLAGGPSPGLASASMGRESEARQEDMGMTDADLLDVAAVLMSEEGPLDELL